MNYEKPSLDVTLRAIYNDKHGTLTHYMVVGDKPVAAVTRHRDGQITVASQEWLPDWYKEDTQEEEV